MEDYLTSMGGGALVHAGTQRHQKEGAAPRVRGVCEPPNVNAGIVRNSSLLIDQ